MVNSTSGFGFDLVPVLVQGVSHIAVLHKDVTTC